MTGTEIIAAYPSGSQVLELLRPFAKDTKEKLLAALSRLVKEVEASSTKGWEFEFASKL